MFFCKFRKIISGCLIGFGIGIIMVLLLPPVVWLFITGVAVMIVRNKIFIRKINLRRDTMTIVVKKVPKFLRGVVKFVFGIK